MYRYNNGQKKEKEEKCEPEDYSMKRAADDGTKSREEQRFVVPKKRKLQRPMRNSCYGYSGSQFTENSDDESEVDFRTSNGERISRDGIVFSPPRMIRRLQDYTDNTDSNASLSSDETYKIENLKSEDHAHGEASSHIHDRYRVPLGADTGHSSEFNHSNPLHINIADNHDDSDDAVFERRSRSTMLLTSNFQNIVRNPEEREEGGQAERCTSTEVTSTKPDEVLLSCNDTAATSPASDNGEGQSSAPQTHEPQPNLEKSDKSPSIHHSAQYDQATASASIENLLPKLAEATTSPQSSDILRIADSTMNYQAATANILQTPFSLAQSLAYPYMSLPFLQYSLPQTLMALTPPVNSLPVATTPSTTTVQSQDSPKDQTIQSPTTQQGQQPQPSPSNSDSWDRAVSCRECGKMLKSERMLELHMNTAHTHKTVYPCKQCGKIFYAASSLHSHKKRTHTSLENKFKCPNCVRFYAFQSELLRHIDTAHMPISRTVTSNNSATQLGSPRSLLNYNNTNQPMPVQSKLQSPTTSQSESVKQDVEASAAIANHVNGVKKEDTTDDNGTDSEYRFKCQQCGQMLKSRECLNLHINAKHTQKHAYPCNYCDKVFYAPSSRFCHVRRVHASKEQKFCCDYCDKVCTFHYELRNHIKLSHKDKAVPESMLPDSATPSVKDGAGSNVSLENGEHG